MIQTSQPDRPQHVLFVVTEDWYFCSHRLELAKGLRQRGMRVSVATAEGCMTERIRAAGFEHHPLRLDRQSRNPVSESVTCWDIYRACRRLKPDVVHLVGMKPILYGTAAARLARVPAVMCAVAGMGHVFLPGNWKKTVLRATVQQYYRVQIRGNRDVQVIVQNPDDRDLIVRLGMAHADQVTIIRGAGVDLTQFAPTAEPAGVPVVFTHSRMLWNKGLRELVEAADLLKQRQVACRFVFAGIPDPANPSSIPETTLREWHDRGSIQWLGRRDDIAQLLAKSHLACLPSHGGEGIPLSLIEAAASGKPIVTTDVPGCREVVRHGINGKVVPAKAVEPLANALQELLENGHLRRQMGFESRSIAESELSLQSVQQATWELYQRALARPSRGSLAATEQRHERAAA
jgi:glycosyltransferase involved in cell wall biosynthesis